MWGDSETQFFYELTPDNILAAVEQLGFHPTGRFFQLNSLENRVYEVEIDVDEEAIESESERFLILKFYRPGRWNKEQIIEEHDFMFQLLENDIPVVAPFRQKEQSLFTEEQTGLLFCYYPKCHGRAPDEIPQQDWEQIGRLLGRLHSTGISKPYKHRLSLSADQYLYKNFEQLSTLDLVPNHYLQSYEVLIKQLDEASKPHLSHLKLQRIHGDCHLGNVIKRDPRYFLIDFDDTIMGPPVQDFWPLLPNTTEPDFELKKNSLLSGYNLMNQTPVHNFQAIPFLRAFRMFHFTAWIGKRWEDPIFKKYFPHYGTDLYFEEQINDLKVILGSVQNTYYN